MRKPHIYWDEGVTLVSGCTKCSPGCDNCWAMAMEKRFAEKISGKKIQNLMHSEPVFHTDRLTRFNKKKPTVFSIWNDLHHEFIPNKFKQDVYFRMRNIERHTFLILTKRPQELVTFYTINQEYPFWPLDNIWHGLTICNQQEADEKIPIFLQVPGKTFLSIEPCLSEIDLKFSACGWKDGKETGTRYAPEINAVILGCETGAKARPMDIDWARSIAEQCKAAGVPLFTKALTTNGKPNHNIEVWPEDLRIRQLVW